MAMEKGRPLPKFGEWDVNNPASAEGFTVIFNKARDEKKTNNNPNAIASSQQHNHHPHYTGAGGGYGPHGDDPYRFNQRKSRRWFCCG